MATTKVSYQMVAEAAERLAEQGESVTVRAVTAVVGGSASTITKFLGQWKSARPPAKVEDVVVDPRIGQIMVEQIKAAVGVARGDIEKRLQDAEGDLAEVAKVGTEAEERVEALVAELHSTREQNQELNGRIRQLEGDAEHLKAETTSAILSAEEKASAETKMREAAQIKLAEAELQLKSLPRLEDSLVQVRMALDAERQMKTDAERKMATAEAKAEGLSARLGDAHALIARLENDLAEVRKDLAVKTELAGLQGGTINALRQQISEFEKKIASMASGKARRSRKDGAEPEVQS